MAAIPEGLPIVATIALALGAAAGDHSVMEASPRPPSEPDFVPGFIEVFRFNDHFFFPGGKQRCFVAQISQVCT